MKLLLLLLLTNENWPKRRSLKESLRCLSEVGNKISSCAKHLQQQQNILNKTKYKRIRIKKKIEKQQTQTNELLRISR